MFMTALIDFVSEGNEHEQVYMHLGGSTFSELTQALKVMIMEEKDNLYAINGNVIRFWTFTSLKEQNNFISDLH